MESPFVTDCWQILELFSKLETLRFADFVQVWKETRFVYLQGVGQDEYQQREILVQLFSTASAYLSDCFPVNVRVAALYLLYALYNTQTHEPSVQIRLVPEMWIKLEELHLQLRNEGHCDADYIACKLKQDKALRLTATPTQLSLGNWGGDIGERALVGFIHSHILSDESCLLLQLLDPDNIVQMQSPLVAYQQAKLNNSSVLPSMMLRPSTLASQLQLIKDEYLAWRNQGVVTATPDTSQVDTSQPTPSSARQRIVEKAFSSDTTSIRRRKRKSTSTPGKINWRNDVLVMPRPRCFFDITINGIPTGRIVFELFNDVLVGIIWGKELLQTIEIGEKGEGLTTYKPLHYKGVPFHRVVKGFIIQGGDFANGNGTGGESIYGGTFDDENFSLKHDGQFQLSMANRGPNTNGSQFFITTRPAPHLDGMHTVFGRVVDGQKYVSEIENQRVDTNHRPYADIRIVRCGELVLIKPSKVSSKKTKKTEKKKRKREVEESEKESSSLSDSSEASESSSEEEEVESSSSSEEEMVRKKKRKKKQHSKKDIVKTVKSRKVKKKQLQKQKIRKDKTKKRKKKKSDSDDDKDDDIATRVVEETPQIVSTILPDLEMLPEVHASKPSWLMRRSRTPSPVDKKISQQSVVKDPYLPSTHKVSASGRKLKGRGVMRFKTPPRSGDTPDILDRREYRDYNYGKHSNMRAFSRSPIRRDGPGDTRENIRNRRESPSQRRVIRRRSPYSDSYRREEQRSHRKREYDYRNYSPKQRRQNRSRSVSPAGYQARRQSSSPDKSRTKQPRESRWDSHVKHKRQEQLQKSEDDSNTHPESGEEEKLIVLSKWVRRHSNNESE